MITDSMQIGYLPDGVTQRLITLLHKADDKENLGNWRPITLLNTSNKIIAKALQKRLQPLLPDIIADDQTAFVPTDTF